METENPKINFRKRVEIRFDDSTVNNLVQALIRLKHFS